MKRAGFFLTALFCIAIANVTSSAQSVDSFSDGDFTSSPAWTGDTANWTVVANSDVAAGATGSNTLRLNSDDTSPNQLRTQIANWDVQQSWGFFIGRRGQAYTAQNHAIIWLYANESDLLSSTVDGYRLLIGDDTGADEIFLQRVVNGVATTILASSGAIPNGLTDIGFLVRVTRDSAGLFALYTSTLPAANGTGAIATDQPNATNVTVNQGSAIDTTITPAANGFFGVVVVHSTSAAAKSALELDQIDLVAAPTEVTLASFAALSSDKQGVCLQWQTGYEVRNLGFNIYREQGGKRTKINPALIGGSALMIGPKTTLAAGLSYAWLDTATDVSAPALYWLEDIDLTGKRTLHGPIAAISAGGKLPTQANALLLGKQNSNAATVQQQLITPAVKTQGGFGRAGVTGVNSLQTQWTVAGQAGAKLSIRADGWYRVTQGELVAAGFDVSRDPLLLQLYVEGVEVPIKVNGGASGHLDPADSIEFYAKAIDTISTDLHAHYLINGKTPGRRINVVASSGTQSRALNFSSTIERKERSTYFAALKNGDTSNWFGPIITSDVVTEPLTVQRLDSSFAAGAVLEVALQGVTAGTNHSVKVMLNGSDVGTINFSGQAHQVSALNISNSALVEGNNTVTLQALGGEMDINLLDYVRLTYSHTFAADNNQLLLAATGQELVTISGFNAATIRALDVTDPNNAKEIIGTTNPNGGGFSITFAAQDAGQRVLYAFVDSAAAHPAEIAANQPSNWNSAKQSADLVIISHRNFIASLDSLKSLRRAQGYLVSVADVEDLYDEFSYGARTPQAIKDFLSRARSAWKRPPRFVLLVGDASSDPRNYLGLGDNDFVPSKLIDTTQMETASDDWMVDFNNDGLAELAIGRLPARTAGESLTMVMKTVSYAQLARPEGVLLVTDRNEGFDFETASSEVKSLIPSSIPVQEVRRSAMDDATAHSQIVELMQRGPKIVNYIGHGSFGLWRGNLLTSADAPDLANGPEYSLVITMTCLNGQLQDPFEDGLAESLVKAQQGGAVAVWASSALTEADGQALMNKEVIRQIFGIGGSGDQPLTLGEAVMRAKAASTDPDVRRTWVLLGDPLIILK